MLKKIIENNFMIYGIGTIGSLLFLVAAYQDLSDFISRQAIVGYNLVFSILAFGLFLNEFKPKKEEREEEEFITIKTTQDNPQNYPKFEDNLYNPNAKNEWEIEEEDNEITLENNNEIYKIKKENEELKLIIEELKKENIELKESKKITQNETKKLIIKED